MANRFVRISNTKLMKKTLMIMLTLTTEKMIKLDNFNNLSPHGVIMVISSKTDTINTMFNKVNHNTLNISNSKLHNITTIVSDTSIMLTSLLNINWINCKSKIMANLMALDWKKMILLEKLNMMKIMIPKMMLKTNQKNQSNLKTLLHQHLQLRKKIQKLLLPNLRPKNPKHQRHQRRRPRKLQPNLLLLLLQSQSKQKIVLMIPKKR